ncbi:hypothetical protein FHS19_004171 [Paenibacillus rhizosphaerae]|uniref:Uncharacterized protein n=1 Tax=Paenibacillus rhizosphaerae TaxID=297318 RepID=A0A839TRP3_9BACL|nr:hypothetical protein [Paenibacillus rhizosphaerae]MBB3129496.1 hypothetical protein [Paenibacillus rhizosphaerae]
MLIVSEEAVNSQMRYSSGPQAVYGFVVSDIDEARQWLMDHRIEVRRISNDKKVSASSNNMLMLLVWIYWCSLFYWCMEGYVPAYLIIGSCLFLIRVWVCGNVFWIRRAQLAWGSSLLIIGVTLFLMYFDPILKPIYFEKIHSKAMHPSFQISLAARDSIHTE